MLLINQNLNRVGNKVLEVGLEFRKRDVSALVKIDTLENFFDLTLSKVCKAHLVEHLF